MALRPASVFAAGLALAAVPAGAERLLCLGTSPDFMMIVEGPTTSFDYLGDGTFAFDPPLPGRLTGGHATELVASRARIPVYFEERACRAIGVDLPVRVELGIETADGLSLFTGCCQRRAE